MQEMLTDLIFEINYDACSLLDIFNTARLEYTNGNAHFVRKPTILTDNRQQSILESINTGPVHDSKP